MKILLDTHILLWAAIDELPLKAEQYVNDKSNQLIFSSASIWEVVIKSELNRKNFNVDPSVLYTGLINAGYEELPITNRHILMLKTIPNLHKDSFDRMLLAQSACFAS